MPIAEKPILLLILDGFGCRVADADNAITRAAKPNFDRLWHDYPHTLIQASEAAVGLPAGQMGNSEVGHLNIGAGRVVYQEYTRIDRAIYNGHFSSNLALNEVIDKLDANGGALHIFGLLSDGGVHSHENHIHAMLDLALRRGLKKVYVHAFLDGRDTPPRSAEAYIRCLQDKMDGLRGGRIASIVGRYYAMDRDKRWDRVKVAFDLLTLGRAEYQAPSAGLALEMAYARGENDEFVKPTAIVESGRRAGAHAGWRCGGVHEFPLRSGARDHQGIHHARLQ
jgi:2,3-bisphosphoglycerate-independent phosphoglycerate mutase